MERNSYRSSTFDNDLRLCTEISVQTHCALCMYEHVPSMSQACSVFGQGSFASAAPDKTPCAVNTTNTCITIAMAPFQHLKYFYYNSRGTIQHLKTMYYYSNSTILTPHILLLLKQGLHSTPQKHVLL